MLTDTQCRNAKPKEKPYKLADANGLYLEIKPNGVKAWRYRFELPTADGGKKESVFAMGEYVAAPGGESPDEARSRQAGGRYTLSEAREQRTKARDLVKQGINPAHQRQADKAKQGCEAANTFKAVAEEWLAAKDWEQVTKDRRLDMLKRVVFPKIGELPVKQVSSAQVLDVLKTAAGKNGPSVAVEAKRTMSGVFELAIATLRAETDPVYPVRKALPVNKTQHKRPLTTEEVGALLRAVDGYPGQFETLAAFNLMWLTLCRPSEVAEAYWSEFDLDAALWRIPAKRMKMRQDHLIPLPTQAVKILRSIHALTGAGDFVFPGRSRRTKSITTATFRQMLYNLGWAGKYSPHATRATGSTRLNEIGYPSDWIERQLAHADPNAVRRTYNQADHFADRAKMMQQWAEMLDAWKAGNTAKVVPIRGMTA